MVDDVTINLFQLPDNVADTTIQYVVSNAVDNTQHNTAMQILV